MILSKNLSPYGTFSGYASIFDVIDHHGDVIRPGAFTESLHHKGDKIKLLWQHNQQKPIGTLIRIKEDSRGLRIEARLALGAKKADEAYALLKNGSINGLSIGYRIKQSYQDPQTGKRIITKIDLLEISLVTFPANELAKVLYVKSAATTTYSG